MTYDRVRHNEAAARSRARRRGSDVPYMRKGPEAGPLLERLVSHIDVGDCWEWTGALTKGYGTLSLNSRHRAVAAHRVMYETLVGPIPAGLTLDHLCRNRRCVNPDHLEPVTNRENVVRGPRIQRARLARLAA